jgi:hypothetical protein
MRFKREAIVALAVGALVLVACQQNSVPDTAPTPRSTAASSVTPDHYARCIPGFGAYDSTFGGRTKSNTTDAARSSGGVADSGSGAHPRCGTPTGVYRWSQTNSIRQVNRDAGPNAHYCYTSPGPSGRPRGVQRTDSIGALGACPSPG